MLKATVTDVVEILDRHASDLIRMLDLPTRQVQLSIPMDEGEPRIRVSVADGANRRLPKGLVFELDGRKVRVPLERSHDFQDYRIHR